MARPLGSKNAEKPPEAFWSRVEVGDPNDCWPWTGRTEGGYGRLRWNREHLFSHRLAYRLANGKLPDEGFHVLHKCVNYICCNPAHLFEGTYYDSNHNTIIKNRHPIAKLSELNVQQIKRKIFNGQTNASIAKESGVSPATVASIRKSRSWQHVDAKDIKK
jgi:hypothetical protein